MLPTALTAPHGCATTANGVAPCPQWCTSHDVTPDADDSVFVVHRAVLADSPARVEVRQGVFVEPEGGLDEKPVDMVLDGEAYTVPAFRQLLAAGALAVEVATG